MPVSVELSRAFLHETGGWKEMKEARSLHTTGRVSEATYEGAMVSGLVQSGGKALRVRLEIRSRTDVVNHCPCLRARREGIICAHALAVGLEVLEPSDPDSPAAAKPASPKAASIPLKITLSPSWPAFTEVADAVAVPAQLHLIGPAQLASAWEKGVLTLGVEIEIEGTRQLLPNTPPSTRCFFETEDAAVYRWLQALTPETVPGILRLTPDQLADLWMNVPGFPRFSLGKTKVLTLSSLPLRPRLERRRDFLFSVGWPPGGEILAATSSTWVLLPEGVLKPVAPGLANRWRAVLSRPTTVPAADIAEAWSAWRPHFAIDSDMVRQAHPQVMLEIEGSLRHLDATLRFDYGAVKSSAESSAAWEHEGHLFLADTNAEAAAARELLAAGFTAKATPGSFVLKDAAAILQFLAYGYPALAARWSTDAGERFTHALGQVEPIETRLDFRSSGEDWFAVEMGFGSASGESVSRAEIDRLLQMGQSSKALRNGRVGVLANGLGETLDEMLRDCEPRQVAPGQYQIDRRQADYLHETAAAAAWSATGTVPWKQAEGALEFYDLPPDFDALLRPYQREGIRWLQARAAAGMGGILADDMGLGKTIQTLALIYSLGGQTLVVCPSSLVFNWIAEAARFLPDLASIALVGPDREKLRETAGEASLWVTSYALLRRDEEWYRQQNFDLIILDEAQQIKNPESQVSQIAHRLPGRHRFALTGTPVENSVRDLWSICQFALPGYLGKRADFAERYEKPLAASDPPPAVRERLARRLRPVILRRLKQEVATDLPDRLEQVVYCELSASQKEVYRKLLDESRRTLLDAEGGKKRMLALTALLRLRQTCCDLRLLGLDQFTDEEASIKGEVLAELLDEALEGGHRVLVFSQFVELLQLQVPRLAAQSIDFCYLDGSTRNRGDVVARFQTGTVPVFLISLKAGGVGLNLTAADTVIHVDPWWNPAVEAQATDRAHRIGQSRVVTSYKLITRGTVEEKILALQERKRALTSSLLLDASEARLGEDELMSLFE